MPSARRNGHNVEEPGHDRGSAAVRRSAVAKLSRLRLTEEEVETMAGELSGILEHVDRIAALDLDGVPPTSHVVELENVLRPDEPRPSWPREEILAPAPEPVDGAFRVPSPQADA